MIIRWVGHPANRGEADDEVREQGPVLLTGHPLRSAGPCSTPRDRWFRRRLRPLPAPKACLLVDAERLYAGTALSAVTAIIFTTANPRLTAVRPGA